MKIQKSKEYKLFRSDITNRQVGKIGKIQASMKKYGFLPAYPIYAVRSGSNFVIKDGQHRFAAAQSLGIDILFVVLENEKGISIPEINNTQRRWSIRDYVLCFKAQGKQDYAKLLQFSEFSKLPLNISAELLSNNLPDSHNKTDAIKAGTFKITTPDYANEVSAVISACSGMVGWYRNSYFVSAVARLLRVKDVSSAHLIDRIKSNQAMLVLQPTIEMFLKMLDDILNRHARVRKPYAFMAIEETRKRNVCQPRA